MTSLKDISQLKILKLNSAKDLISQWSVDKNISEEEYLSDKLYKNVTLICNKVLIGVGKLMLFNGYIQWEGEKDLKYKFPYEQFNIEKSYSSKVNIILSRNILLEFSFKTNYEEAEKCYKLLELEKKINNLINQPIKFNSLSNSRSNNISNEFKFDFKSRLQFSSPLSLQKKQNFFQQKFNYQEREVNTLHNNSNNNCNSNNNNNNKITSNNSNCDDNNHSWFNFSSESATEDNKFDINDITTSSLSPFKPIMNVSATKDESNIFSSNINSSSPSKYLKNKKEDKSPFNLYDNKDKEEEGFQFFSSDNESNSDEDDPFSLENYDLSISSSEYKKSKEKLPPDEVKTNEQTTIKLIQLLLKWEYNVSNDFIDKEDDYPTFKNIIISYNYINLGIGNLIIYPQNLRFEGDIIKMQNQNKNLSFFDFKIENFNNNESLKHVILHFPYKKLSDIHKKIVDDNVLILVILSETIFLQFSFQKGFIKESNECIELIKNEVKKENQEENLESNDNIECNEQEENLNSTPTTSSKMNKKVSYSVNNQLILNERVNDLITTSSRKKTASPYTPSLSPLALRKNSFVTMNDILDKIEIYYNNFSLLSDNKDESPTTSTANIGIKKKNDNTNNELIDKLYKAKIKIMEESKDILIKRINELYEEQLVKLKEEYTTDYTKKEKLRECQLCFDSMECKVIIPCGHKLCEDCAKRLTTVSNKCPWDRQEIESIEFIKSETELS